MDVYCSPVLSLSPPLTYLVTLQSYSTKKSRDQQSYWLGLQILRPVGCSSAVAKTDPDELLWWPVYQERHWIGTFYDILSQFRDLWAQHIVLKTCYIFRRLWLDISLSWELQPLPFLQFSHCQFMRQSGLLCWTLPQRLACVGKTSKTYLGVYTDIPLMLNKFHLSWKKKRGHSTGNTDTCGKHSIMYRLVESPLYI